MNPNLENELVAAGALFAALTLSEIVKVARIVDDEETAAFVVQFPFLKSPYRVTVTMAPQEET